MSLGPLHEQIARIALALPEAGQVALAGGGAMLADDLVDRPTQDVDLFTPDPSEATRLADALVVALGAEGAQVRVDRREPGFIRLAVTVADGRSVVVEAPMTHASAKRCSCRSAGCSTPKKAADKTLALFGRASARDLVDEPCSSVIGSRAAAAVSLYQARPRTGVAIGGAAAASCRKRRRRWPVAILINFSGPPRAPTPSERPPNEPSNGHV